MRKAPALSLPALMLYKGQTRHVRYVPFTHSFMYKLFLIDIDIDRLEEADTQSVFFRTSRAGFFSFRRADHGPGTDTPLRPWAENMLHKAGIDLEGGPIRLVTLPRHLFYKFAPISLWFGYGPDNDLRGVIYEVNNTFGDTHAYVAAMPNARSQHEADKRLYVSPFFDVTGKYRFTLRAPDERLSLVIENIVEGTRTHMANIKAQRSPATSAAFVLASLTRPFSTLGVTAAIHYEALKLWLKKARYISRPCPPNTDMTLAHEANPSLSRLKDQSE